jgi:hypothetical protein
MPARPHSRTYTLPSIFKSPQHLVHCLTN